MNWRASPFCCGKFTIIRACTGTHESTRGFAGCNVTSCDEPINGRRQKSVKNLTEERSCNISPSKQYSWGEAYRHASTVVTSPYLMSWTSCFGSVVHGRARLQFT